MAMFRSSVGLALRRSVHASATSRFWSNGTADLMVRGLAPAAAASRFTIGGCGSSRSIHTEQQIEKSIQKSKQRLLNLYMNAQTDKNHALNVQSVEGELDYLIRHLQDKATRSAMNKIILSKIESKEINFHILDTIVALAVGVLMIFYVMWIVGFS